MTIIIHIVVVLIIALKITAQATEPEAELVGTWAFVETDVNEFIADGFYSHLVNEGSSPADAKAFVDSLLIEAKKNKSFSIWDDILFKSDYRWEHDGAEGVWRIEDDELILDAENVTLRPKYVLDGDNLILLFTKDQLTSFAVIPHDIIDVMLSENDVVKYFLKKGFGEAYVTVDRLNVRLSPSPSGEITNILDFGQRVGVFESRDGWARISRYYDTVLEGEPGTMTAQWVAFKYLSKSKPAPRAVQFSLPTTPLAKAIKGSDDFHKYGSEFFAAAKKLISQGRCSVKDFKEMGGWMRSTSRKLTYFTYCGGMSNTNRIYLDVTSGQLSFSAR